MDFVADFGVDIVPWLIDRSSLESIVHWVQKTDSVEVWWHYRILFSVVLSRTSSWSVLLKKWLSSCCYFLKNTDLVIAYQL